MISPTLRITLDGGKPVKLTAIYQSQAPTTCFNVTSWRSPMCSLSHWLRAIEGDQASSADLVILKVGDRTITTVLKYKNETRTPKELWQVNEWVHLKDVLGQLKALCSENDITPLVVFIPSTAHIYAEYSTHESGANWLSIRDQQIAAKDNV